MNKTIALYIVVAFLNALELIGQTPPTINYQAILRNTQTGEELVNTKVLIISKFISGGANGEIVYQEDHYDVTTSPFGLINLQLGDGNPVQGDFNAIPWANGDIWLSIEIDAGDGLKPLGITKFSSVPYALYAESGPEPEPNLDNDPTNEIQDLILTGNALTISNNDSATPIDLSIYENVPNLDNDPTNEIQDLILTGNALTISDNANATAIDLSVYANEPNLDNDPTNEIQDLILTGNVLTISNNANATEIDLSTYENVPNLDNDPTNEIQDLILTGNVLTISNNANATPIDLGTYENQSLPKNHIFIGNDSDVATPSPMSGDVVLTDAGTTSINSLHNIPISTTAPTNGQKLTYNSVTNIWEPKSDGEQTGVVKYYSVDPMDFVELNDPNGSATLQRHNGLKFFNEEAPFAMLRSTHIRRIGAAVHLPHGATITEVKFILRKTSGNIKFSLERKQLTNYSTGNDMLASGISSFNGNGTVTLSVNSDNVVNNQDYTYRVFARFSKETDDDDEDDAEDIEQAVYGVIITYIE